MTLGSRNAGDYQARFTEAAHRVLVDVGQILASFSDCIIVIGGWVPELLLKEVTEPHVGSMDVDLALDAERLNDGRYAELLSLLLETKRYQPGTKSFQLVTSVDLGDGEGPIQVEVEFLASHDVTLEKHAPKLLPNFRVLQVPTVRDAFRRPETVVLEGQNVRGAQNIVTMKVASMADYLVMKAHAIGGRDKPKDSYDLCYCLNQLQDRMEELAVDWRRSIHEESVQKAIEILREKFASVSSFGPQHVVEFYNSAEGSEASIQARRAYELVQKFLGIVTSVRVI